VTDQPTAGADNAVAVAGVLPRNGIGINFDNPCFTYGEVESGPDVETYNNYVESSLDMSSSRCASTTRGSLNHVEVQLSQTQVTIWASDAGGANFRELYTAPISLNFSRGYVFFQTNERAPAKYNFVPDYANYYWSDLGFDGPNVSNGEIGYSVPDALTPDPNTDPFYNGAPNVAYGINSTPDQMVTCCDAFGNETPIPNLSIPNVNLTGVTRAEFTFDLYYGYTGALTPQNAVLNYSVNRGPLQSAAADANPVAEQICSGCPGPGGGGGVEYVIPVPVASLVNGTNTLDLAVEGGNNSYPPMLTSVDLLTFTS
jgi:hypothetical protein